MAWDIGALTLARRLSAALNATLIHQAYSRLVIDCNRDPDRADSIVVDADRWTIAGNRGLAAEAALARRHAIFDPYHARIAREMDHRAALGRETLLVCVHSFTPVMAGRARPWHVGVLHLGNSPASSAMLALLRGEHGLVVGDNEPYAMTNVDFTAPLHAHRRGIDAVELEVRQDLLQDEDQAMKIAAMFARLLPLVAPAEDAPAS